MERETVTAHDAGITLSSHITPAALRISHTSGEPLVTIHCDGRVDVNPAFTLDEAAMAFWEAVRKLNPRSQQ